MDTADGKKVELDMPVYFASFEQLYETQIEYISGEKVLLANGELEPTFFLYADKRNAIANAIVRHKRALEYWYNLRNQLTPDEILEQEQAERDDYARENKPITKEEK